MLFFHNKQNLFAWV